MPYPYNSSHSSEDHYLENSQPYESYDMNTLSSSNNSDTTTTYVDNSVLPHTKTAKRTTKRKPVISTIASKNSRDDSVLNEIYDDPLHLEEGLVLKNEKRLFSWMFNKKVPPINSPEERKIYPWKSTNLISRGLFFWLLPILYKGYKRTLVPNDLYYLTEKLSVQYGHDKFDSYLQNGLDKAKAKHLKKNPDLANFKWPKFIVPICLFKCFWIQYTASCFFLALSFVCQALSPLLTRRLIDFVEYRYFGIEKSLNKGIGYTIAAVALIYINGLLLNHFFHNAMITGAQCKGILSKSLLLKSFKLSANSRNKFPVGRITSLLTTDLSRIDLAIGFQPLVICFPIPVIISIVLLVTMIGVTALTGIGLFLVSLVICVMLTKKLFNTRESVVDYTDERIGLMREVLSNLKIIKFYAWELAYKLRITKVREQEMRLLFTIKVLRNFITAYAVTLPTLTSMLSFVTMWATNSMKSPGVVFSSLSLYSILAQAIMLLPIALATGADALIGFNRCREFLSCEELDDSMMTRLDNMGRHFVVEDDASSEFDTEGKDLSIKVENANFFWDSYNNDSDDDSLWDAGENLTKKQKEKLKRKKHKELERQQQIMEEKEKHQLREVFNEEYSIFSEDLAKRFRGLRNIDLTIRKKEFIVITGIIGSGKSSLLSALAGFMKLESGKMKNYDNFLLCSQPWIQNATVRNNIIFGSEFDPHKYNRILYACALEDDLKMLPAGDLTEIGERGITLSGGQKARINLARAVYNDPDTILMDDVLSAVDSRVGKHIIENLFNDLLKDKTRILATHQLSLIDNADKVVFLNGDGTIDVGPIPELAARNMAFKRLFEYNLEAAEQHDDDEKEEFESNSYVEHSPGFTSDTSAGRVVEEEERATNAISWDVYKKYINLGSGIFGISAAPVFLFWVVIATFCQVFTNTWLSWWTEKKFAGKSDKFYVALYVMFAFLTVIFTAVEFTILAYMNSKSAEILNVKAVEKVLHAPMSFVDTNPLGRILNRFTKDTDSLDNEISEQLRLFIFPLALIIGIVILCICYLPWFAIAVPFLAISFTFISNFYQGSSREIKRLEAIQRSLVYNNFNETLTGMTTIKSYKRESAFIKRNDDYINKMNEAYFLSIATQRWLSVHLDIVAAIFALIICMLCITNQFNISASSTGLLMSYVIQIVGLLSLTIRSMTQVENEMNSVERLHHYAFHLEQEPAYTKTEFSPPKDWPSSGYIQFNDISLKYRPQLPLVLKNLNFSVYPREKVGICGRTGAGKSSIMSALYRLVEVDNGSITIDGINIADLGLFELRSRLSIIPQDPVLFQGTIRKNLDPFSESDDAKLWDALRRSGLIEQEELEDVKLTKFDPKNKVTHDQLHKFHLDQIVGDDGENFSLGERQLISLARALVRSSKILILDEATSSVDYETDERIQKTIAREFKDCTILCIAHRLKTILNYDRILVMDHGEVIEKGVPHNLYDESGVFRKMCEKANIVKDDFEEVIAY